MTQRAETKWRTAQPLRRARALPQSPSPKGWAVDQEALRTQEICEHDPFVIRLLGRIALNCVEGALRDQGAAGTGTTARAASVRQRRKRLAWRQRSKVWLAAGRETEARPAWAGVDFEGKLVGPAIRMVAVTPITKAPMRANACRHASDGTAYCARARITW
jgi:hypothetical protein